MKGTRVQAIIRELRGEKIDIVEWSEDPVLFVTNALSPAKVQRVSIKGDEREREMEVVVEDKQLSLAIGKKGQNVRLAAKLTGWRIDIKSEEEKRREVEAEFGALELGAADNSDAAATEDGIEPATEDGPEAVTEDGVEAVTEDGVEAATEDGVEAATEDGVEAVTAEGVEASAAGVAEPAGDEGSSTAEAEAVADATRDASGNNA
jgi:N utilization substance protein A